MTHLEPSIPTAARRLDTTPIAAARPARLSPPLAAPLRLPRRGTLGVLAPLAWKGLAAACSLACQSPALVRTARTLPEGGSDISFSLNLTRVSLREETSDGVPLPLRDFNLPNPLPDVLYDYGLTDDIELGGRLSLGSGLIEARSKLRFVEAANGALHVALAPAAGYRVLALVNGPVLTLPLIVTIDLSPRMSFSVGALASYASYSTPSRLEVDDLDLSGNTLYAGGGFGLEFRPAFGIHVMPTVEVQRSVSRRGSVDDLPVIDVLFLGVTLGWASREAPPHAESSLPE
jgi:hypothetical protein